MSIVWNDGTPDFSVQRQGEGWSVALPHQCESWDIAGERDYSGVPQAQAIAELEAFLADGQQALAALKRGEPYGSTA